VVGNARIDDASHGSRWRIAGWSVAALLLLLPLFAMQVTKEVVWRVADFVLAGVLLIGTGLTLELAARKTGNWAYRAGGWVWAHHVLIRRRGERGAQLWQNVSRLPPPFAGSHPEHAILLSKQLQLAWPAHSAGIAAQPSVPSGLCRQYSVSTLQYPVPQANWPAGGSLHSVNDRCELSPSAAAAQASL